MVNLEVIGTQLNGQTNVPGDKSISHRALILGAIAEGQTLIKGFLESKDCLATLQALQSLGVPIDYQPGKAVKVQGVGLYGLKAPIEPLDCQNSGTSMRLLAGLLSAQPFNSTLIGDDSLSHRPMDRIVIPLRQMGANITGRSDSPYHYPPLNIQSCEVIHPLQYSLPIGSAQVKSALLLAALYAAKPTMLVENIASRDHTEQMLLALGADIKVSRQIVLTPGKSLKGQEIAVPGDISSAAFFIAAASFTRGSHILLTNVGVNPRRTGVIRILQSMGADIVLHNERAYGNEKVADIEVKGRELQGFDVPPEWVASAIDEFPILFVAAALAKGESIMRGIQELRFKETDRIAVMAAGLKELGVPLAILPDGIIIRGVSSLKGGSVESKGDHRIAMALAMAALKANEPVIIRDCKNIATSFPNFSSLASQLGLSIKVLAGGVE